MIGTPLRWGVQAGGFGAKTGAKVTARTLGLPVVAGIKTAGGVKMLVNHFRRDALEKGIDPAKVNESAIAEQRRVIDTEGLDPDTQLTFNQLSKDEPSCLSYLS